MADIVSKISITLLIMLIGYNLLKPFFSKDKSLIWSPITIISLCYIYYCIMPYVTGGSEMYHLTDSSASVLYNIGSLISYSSVLIAFNNSHGRSFTKWNNAIHEGNILRLSLIFFAIAFVCYSSFRGIHFSIAAKEDALELVHSGFEHYFLEFLCLYEAAFALLLICYKEKKKKIWLLLLMWYILVTFIFAGTRGRIVLMVISACTVFYLYPRPKKMNYIIVGSLAVMCYLGFAIMEYSRSYSKGIQMDKVAQMSMSDATKGAEENRSVYWFGSLIMDRYDRENRLIYLEPVLTAVCMPIPRAIFPWKPDGKYLDDAEMLCIGNNEGGAAFVFFVEGFMSLSWVGLILYSLFFGWLSKQFWSNYRNNPTSLGAITALALYSAVCYSIVARGYLASALDNFVYVVCIPFWIAMIDNKYFNKKNR